MKNIKSREIERKEIESFSKEIKLTETLFRFVDDKLKDKYDQNYFYTTSNLVKSDYIEALNYQKKNNDSFIKFVSYIKYSNSFNMDEDIILTLKFNGTLDLFKENEKVVIKDAKIEDVINLEVKHYSKIYGETFARNNVLRNKDVLKYVGAYIDDKLVGCLTYFKYNDSAIIDDLLVDIDYRNKYIATTLLKRTIQLLNVQNIYLHADENDTPKEIYFKLGFEIVDKSFEYSISDENKINKIYEMVN